MPIKPYFSHLGMLLHDNYILVACVTTIEQYHSLATSCAPFPLTKVLPKFLTKFQLTKVLPQNKDLLVFSIHTRDNNSVAEQF